MYHKIKLTTNINSFEMPSQAPPLEFVCRRKSLYHFMDKNVEFNAVVKEVTSEIFEIWMRFPKTVIIIIKIANKWQNTGNLKKISSQLHLQRNFYILLPATEVTIKIISQTTLKDD